ncbi:MAG TPA: hypothetical protein ENN76_01960, partial [Euryarchaeota archaeon]|nr:hypothetical protein [Euryarchaeota archaeon]
MHHLDIYDDEEEEDSQTTKKYIGFIRQKNLLLLLFGTILLGAVLFSATRGAIHIPFSDVI